MTNYNKKFKDIQEEKNVLEDIDKKEKTPILQKCTSKKKKNPKFKAFIAPLTTKKNIERIATCGDHLFMLADSNLENFKLHKADFCGNRFCPMCSWRLACRDSLEISILMDHLKKEENKAFIFLTLTTPNVKGDKLNDAIKDYNNSFKKLMSRKEVKNIVKGYIRKLEVTYQKEKYITKELWNRKKSYYKNKGLEIGDLEPNFDTYHPHFHVVIAVSKSYFNQTKQYINRDRWLKLWQESTRDFTITQVDVRKAKHNDYKEVYELAKYSAKDTDYLISKPVFETFYKSLKGKQLLVFSGLFKEAHKMFENGELDVYKEKDNIKYTYILYFKWCKNEYEKTRLRELTEEELKEIDKKLIDSMEVEVE